MAVSRLSDEDLQFNMTEAWTGLRHIVTMCCTMSSRWLGKYLRALVSKGKSGGCHTHMRARTHTLNIYYKFSFNHWVIQIIKSVNVGGCLASCQSNKGNWVTVCMHFCVLRLPLQADQVSKTNSASSTSLSFRAHALVPRVKNRRGLSTIECTWACRALRIKTPSNRKYAKEVIEPFFSVCFHFVRIDCDVFVVSQVEDAPGWTIKLFEKKKESILTDLFYLFLGSELLPPTLSSNLQWNSFMKL